MRILRPSMSLKFRYQKVLIKSVIRQFSIYLETTNFPVNLLPF